MSNYDHTKVEKKWQKKWEENKIYSPDLAKTKSKNKFYNLWMFPYPSGEGLHAGHAFASTGSDAYGRFMRMKGMTVFQPIGYDSFGIHSENFAIKTGEHPTTMLHRTTLNYEKQLRSLGHGYDWTRTVTTSNVEYYKWTQWLFIQLFKAGLAYRKEAPVNWCPSCKTVLADEQVVAGKNVGMTSDNQHERESDEIRRVCERCGTIVEIRNLAQWFFRITSYADRLLSNLDKIDWTEKVVTAQRNWIGKKEGINIKYELKTKDEKLKDKFVVCWTSRPETNFGATFVVVSPEYAKANLIDIIPQDRIEEAKRYIDISLDKSQEERQVEGRKKTGAPTGLFAVNELNGYEMPVYIADFVLSGVGTGAVVGVPGHDKRDFEFATEFRLPIKRVVVGDNNDDSDIKELTQVQEDNGIMVNSEFLNGLDIHDATVKMMDYLEGKDFGTRTTNYHLRDWLISRQRYWGPPIPMIFCEKCESEGKGWLGSDEHKEWIEQSKSKIRNSKFEIRNSEDWASAGWWPEENLPVELPNLTDYKPKGTGRGPLADHPEFYEVKCPYCGSQAKRETDVSDTFLDSAWYFLAYPIQGTNSWKESPSASSGQDLIDNKINESWLPVDLYFGGAEHSVLHLMYARFVTMVLNDLDYLEFEEPFPKFYAHGLMIKDGAKMSKSKGNVVNPDEYVKKFGADTLRLYLMFMGPMDGYPDFRDTGIEGMRKFVDRVWGLFKQSTVNSQQSTDLDIKMHQTVKKVTEDIENYRYNTAISAIMEYVNALRAQVTSDKRQVTNKSQVSSPKSQSAIYNIPYTKYLEVLAQLIAPFAPHMAEEAWELLTKNEKLPAHIATRNVAGGKTNEKSNKELETRNPASSEALGKEEKLEIYDSIHLAKWPEYDPKMIIEDVVTIAIQVNGKLRTTLQVSREEAENKDKLIELAKSDPKVSKWIEDKQIKKEIFIPGKLVNLVSDN